MSSTPGSAIGSTSTPRTVEPGAARPSAEQLGGSGPDGVVARQAQPDAAEVALVGQPVAIELERRGVAERRPRRWPPRRRIGAAGASTTGMPASAQERQALTLGERPPARRGATDGSASAAAGSWPNRVRSAARSGQAGAGRALAPGARARRRSHQARRRSPRRLPRAAQERDPAGLVEQCLRPRAVGSPPVSEM